MRKVISIFVVLSLPAILFWFLKGKVVDGTDIIFPLDPITNLTRAFFAWEEIYNTGSSLFSTQLSLVKFPIYLFFTLLQILGFPITIINKLYYFSLTFFPMLTMFFFLKELLHDKKNIYWKGNAAASVFYVYNLFYLQQIIDQAITLTYIFTPFILFLFLKGIRTGEFRKYGIFIGLVSLFYTPINPNSYAVGVLIIISFITSFLLYSFFKKERNVVRSSLKLLGFSVLFSALFSTFWTIPYLYYLKDSVSSVQSSVEDWLPGVSKNTSFSNVVRLIGAWDWFEKWNGEDYAPYANYILKNPLILLLAYIPILISLAATIVSRRRVKYFFLAILMFGVVFSMGSHPPTGWIYMIFYKYFPAFWIFRSPWYKFGVFMTFSMSVLIAFFLHWYYAKKWSNKFSYLYLVLIFLFVIISFPLFKGDRFIKFSDRKGSLAPLQVQIPDYVFETAEWLNNTGNNGRVILVPQVAWESTEYTWGYGNLVPPLYTLLKKNPMMILPYERKGPGVELMRGFKDSLYNPNSTPSANFLAFLNSKYILLQNDYWYYYFRSEDTPQKIRSFVGQQKNLDYIKTYGEWDLFENKINLPRIYATRTVERLSDLTDVAKLSLDIQNAFTLEDLPVNSKTQNLKTPEISFNRVSPVEYKVEVNSSTPYYLIFQEAYHPGWQIKPKNMIENTHFKINSYANGYFINATGQHNFLIYFAGQKYYHYGQMISAASIIAVISISIIQKYKKSKS